MRQSSKRSSRRTAGSILVAALFASLGLCAAPAAAEAALLRVQSPNADALVRGNVLRVKVRLSGGASLSRAELNGRNITRHFVPAAGGARARIHRSDVKGSLRRGRNFLHLQARSGAERDHEEIVFTRVRGKRGLVASFGATYSPRTGARVKLLPARQGVQVRAKLNGRNVSRLFRDGDPLVRKVDLGASQGLRHGRNRLRVRVHHHSGLVTKRSATFRVPRRTTLPGAGPDIEAAVGSPLRLDAGDSRKPRTKDGRARGGKLRYRWKVIDAPQGAEPELAGRSKGHAALLTRAPGTYTLRLRTAHADAQVATAASSGGSTDTVEVRATPQPNVPVNTLATADGKPGIELGLNRECEQLADDQGVEESPWGRCFYALGNDTTNVLQVVVVERDTLAPVWHANYPAESLGGLAYDLLENPDRKVVTDTAGEVCPAYDDDKLVLMSVRSGFVGFNPDFARALSVFNVSVDAPDADTASDCTNPPDVEWQGPFSIIGVPGMVEGKMWQNHRETIPAPGGLAAAPRGALQGFLKPTSDDPAAASPQITRGFSFADAIHFDTRNPGSGSSPSDDTISIGDQSLPLAPHSGDALLVFGFDPVFPEREFVLQRRITRVSSGAPPRTGTDWSALDDELAEIQAAGGGVALVSVGDMRGSPSDADDAAFESVLSRLDKLGVNPDTFARAVNTEGATYSMLAAGGAGFDSSSVIATGVEDPDRELEVYAGRVSGNLLRGHDGVLYPSTGDPSGRTGPSQLLPVIYGDEADWPLTADPLQDPSRQLAGDATCQEVAFAHLALTIMGQLPAGGSDGDQFADPDSFSDRLWFDNVDPSQCEAQSHPAPQGSPRADTVAENGCVTGAAEVVPDAVSQGPVHDAAMMLRASYQSLDTTYDTTEVDLVQRPDGAPFSDADLDCAKRQLIDELAARDQSTAVIGSLAEVQDITQAGATQTLADVAEEVKTAALSELSAKLEADEAPPEAGMFAALGLRGLAGLGKILNYFSESSPALGQAALLLTVAGEGGGTIFSILEGPPQNPAADVESYVLLASQLDREAVGIDDQITNTLLSMRNGLDQTQEIVVSDPSRLATVDANGKPGGAWQVSADGLAQAQSAYLYRVRQLALQDFIPSTYTGVRWGTAHICQDVTPDLGLSGVTTAYSCWDGTSSWSVLDPSFLDIPVDELDDPVAVNSAPEAFCDSIFSSVETGLPHPFTKPTPGPGDPAGLGNGTEYRPPVSAAAPGDSPRYLDYVMLDSDTVGSKKIAQYPTGIHADDLAPFFAQPGSTLSDPDADTAGGFYAPDFWHQNLGMQNRIACTSAKNSEIISFSTPGGPYEDIDPGDLWPTPPLPD